MKYRLPRMIFAQPAGLHCDSSRRSHCVGRREKHFANLRQSLRKIRQEFRRNLAFIATRPQNPRNQDPSRRFALPICVLWNDVLQD